MKKSLKTTLLLAGLALSFSCHTTVTASSRSWKSWFIEQYFWLKRDKSYYKVQDDTTFQRYLDASREQSDKPYQLDPSAVNGGLKEERLFDMQVFTWNDKGTKSQKNHPLPRRWFLPQQSN